VTGLNGQKQANSIPVTIGLGVNAGGKLGKFGFSFPVLFSYYANSAGTIDYGANMDYRSFILGWRGLFWMSSSEGNLNESSWVFGYEFDI